MTEDDRLRRELRSLPRETASDTFTPRLMRQLEAERPRDSDRSRRGISWNAAWMAAGALLLVVAGWQGLRSDRGSSETAITPGPLAGAAVGPTELRGASHRELEREAAAVRRELERLRRLAAVRDSVIALPGSGEYDYYIDLRPVLDRGSVVDSRIDRALYRTGERVRTPGRGERP